MDLEPLALDDESGRARQSEIVDMGMIHLCLRLRKMGIAFEDAELAMLPMPFVDRLLCRLETLEERAATMQTATEAHEARLAAERQRLELLQEAVERTRGEVAVLSERISAALQSYRAEEKVDGERRRELQRDLQDILRQFEKKELEIRREKMEHDRLNKILKKVIK